MNSAVRFVLHYPFRAGAQLAHDGERTCGGVFAIVACGRLRMSVQVCRVVLLLIFRVGMLMLRVSPCRGRDEFWAWCVGGIVIISCRVRVMINTAIFLNSKRNVLLVGCRSSMIFIFDPRPQRSNDFSQLQPRQDNKKIVHLFKFVFT